MVKFFIAYLRHLFFLIRIIKEEILTSRTKGDIIRTLARSKKYGTVLDNWSSNDLKQIKGWTRRNTAPESLLVLKKEPYMYSIKKWCMGMITYLQMIRQQIHRRRQINKLKKLKEQRLEEVTHV